MRRARRLAARLTCLTLLAALLAGALPLRTSGAEESPYRVVDLAVALGPTQQAEPVVAGSWVVWEEYQSFGEPPRVRARNLDSGESLDLSLAGVLQYPPDADGDRVVTTEAVEDGGTGIYLYHLPDGARTDLASPAAGPSRGRARISGDTVVWVEGDALSSDVYAYDLNTRQLTRLTAGESGRREGVDVSGNLVVWQDRRHAPADRGESDIYGYDLRGRREFRVTDRSELIGHPAISRNVVVWPSLRDGAGAVLGYDLAGAMPFTVARLPAGSSMPSGVDLAGDLVVWSAVGAADEDVFGYDLGQRRAFVVSRALGAQVRPRVAGRVVVWTDYRHSGLGRYETDADVQGARLEPGPAPLPPVVGALDSADARIEIVWPQGGAPVTQASRANVAAWLFRPGTLDLAPCQWNPRVLLWRSLNNEPARVVAVGQRTAGHYFTPDHQAIPTWEFNDVDVSEARDPANKLYFFVTLDGVPSRTNVWAHGADARTYLPNPDLPTGTASGQGAVDARIAIVWPHDGAAVDRAPLANVAALLFRPGTLLSLPTDSSATVQLYRALNNDVGEPVAVGARRIVSTGPLSYPVWDFSDVDVRAAADPRNRYHFTLKVEGVETYTTVWTHGADARTYFPTMDVPTAGCR